MSKTDKDIPWRLAEGRPNKWSFRWWFAPPTKQERHTEWFGPDRAQVRDSLKSAAKEFRAAGEVHEIPPARDHRHCPKKGWWY